MFIQVFDKKKKKRKRNRLPFKIIGRITIDTLIYLVYAKCVDMLPFFSDLLYK